MLWNSFCGKNCAHFLEIVFTLIYEKWMSKELSIWVHAWFLSVREQMKYFEVFEFSPFWEKTQLENDESNE